MVEIVQNCTRTTKTKDTKLGEHSPRTFPSFLSSTYSSPFVSILIPINCKTLILCTFNTLHWNFKSFMNKIPYSNTHSHFLMRWSQPPKLFHIISTNQSRLQQKQQQQITSTIFLTLCHMVSAILEWFLAVFYDEYKIN